MFQALKKIDCRAFVFGAIILTGGSFLHNSAGAEELQKLQELKVAAPLTDSLSLSLSGVGNAQRAVPLQKGKPYFLHLWATWCVPCREELPQLVSFLKAHPQAPIIPVAVDSGAPERVQAFLPRLHVEDLPVWVGDKEQIKKILTHMPEPGLPMTLLVDARGQVRSVSDGGLDWSAPDAWSVFQDLLQKAQ